MAARKIDFSDRVCSLMGASLAVCPCRTQCEIGVEKGPGKMECAAGWSAVAVVVGRQLAAQPGPGVGPVALHGPRRTALDLGRFFDGHPGEDPELHEFGGLRVGGSEPGEGLVQVEEAIMEGDLDPVPVRQLTAAARPALTLAALAADPFDEDAAHRLRGGGKEV